MDRIARQNAPAIPLDELLDHRAWVRSVAHSLVRDAAGADDVEQETWMAALQRPPADRSTLRAWFATVARNAARDDGRARGRRSRREAAVARPEQTESTDEVVARAESHKRVVMAVMDLDEPYRTTVLLRFFEDLPPRDVAERMSCPVETVRTRTKRALAQLRERLGDDERGGWRAAVLPLLAPPTSAERAAPTGDRRMLTIKIAAVAALLLALPVTYALVAPDDAPAANDQPADVATVPPDTNAEPPRRERVIPPPAAPPRDGAPGEDGEDAKDDDGWQTFPPTAPLPDDEDASVYADGELAMGVSVEPPLPRAGEPFELVVTFRNDGTGPLRFHVPEFTGLVPFPRLEMRASDGRVLLPVAASFQSMWQHGLQGEIVRLEPGEEHAVKTRVGNVAEVPDDPARRETGRFARSQKSLELQPSDYTVTAILAKSKPVVPWGEANFKEVEKEVPGLWTGEIRSTPITIRVAPPDEPMLTLHVPDRLAPGEDLGLTLTVSNPSQEDREIRGAFAVRRSQKGGPGYVAWFAFGDRAVPATQDHTRTMTLIAGESRTCRVDLGELVWERVGRKRDVMRRDQWPFARTYPALWVTCGERDEEGKGMLGSNTGFQGLEAAPDLADRGLRMRVETEGLAAAAPFVVVHLRNASAADVAVPRRLRSSQRVEVIVRPADAVTGATRVALRAPEPMTPLAPDDVVVLTPGDEISARIDVSPEWSAALAPGRYDAHARWVNVDACDRDGFDLRPVVGVVVSDAVVVDIAAR